MKALKEGTQPLRGNPDDPMNTGERQEEFSMPNVEEEKQGDAI
jgi:hypothetical protein